MFEIKMRNTVIFFPYAFLVIAIQIGTWEIVFF